jgi:hypothetical protein
MREGRRGLGAETRALRCTAMREGAAIDDDGVRRGAQLEETTIRSSSGERCARLRCVLVGDNTARGLT